MSLPFFYIENYDGASSVTLNEETSKHVVQVLRMKKSEQINLTDGKGNLLICEIVDDNKKHCSVIVKSKTHTANSKSPITIAISLLKNANRFEWFLEKATEIGVSEIIPLLCDHTEKEKFRYDRMKGICISAMLQSQQVWLPVLHQPAQFSKAIGEINSEAKYIAYCDETVNKINLSTIQLSNHSTILIGPEGDFTPQEIELALQNEFVPVSLGNTRLRTETAGVVAAALLINLSQIAR